MKVKLTVEVPDNHPVIGYMRQQGVVKGLYLAKKGGAKKQVRKYLTLQAQQLVDELVEEATP